MSAEALSLSEKKAPLALYLAGAVLIGVLPWLPVGGFVVHLVQTFCYTAIAVMGLNILLGLSGQMSLGHAGFYALGAYGSALASLKLGLPVLASMALGVALSVLAGVLVGIFALRTRGLYLAMTTLAFGFLVDIAAQRWVGLTGGTMGLMGIPGVEFGGPKDSAKWFLYVAMASLLAVQMASDFVAHSAVGRKLRAIRESEVFAASVGIRVAHWRAWVFALCSATAGLAGALFAHQSGFISSDAFTVRLSVALLIAAVIGGLGARSGPLLGTAILMLIVETIAGQEKYGLIIFGAILLCVLLAFPEGMAGVLARLRPRRAQATAGTVAAAPVRGTVTLSIERLEGVPLAIEGVTKRYRGVVAVDNVSIKVRAGSIHGLIGPNGAGKSTLINVVAGIYAPDDGRVMLGGRPLEDLNTAERAHAGMARTFQNLQMIHGATALENVMLGLRSEFSLARAFGDWFLGRHFERADRQAAMDTLSFLGIAQVADKLPGELPYGHRKLVELARAIAQRPQVLLLDEPIAGINTQEAREIAAVLRKLRDLGATILLVEHNMEFVMSLCDAVSVLDHGKLLATGTPQQIQSNPQVIAAYLGQGGGA
jgi:ABC-type branched-subunit amino acid transport system ATPase component/ABC-type branched-subunit amino acid transport system permease subunit